MFGQGKKAYPLYAVEKSTNKQRLNPTLLKQIKTSLGAEREVLIALKDKEIEELQKSIQENREISDDENEDRAIGERARERITKNQKRIDALEKFEEGTLLRLKSEKHMKEIWFDSLSCCPGSWSNDWSDFERIDKRP